MSLLRDPDYVALMQMGERGAAAFGTFCALLMVARDQDNRGVFREPLRVVSARCSRSTRAVLAAHSRITGAALANNSRSWLELSDDFERDGWSLKIRSYDVWNKDNWGGTRVGSGRKPPENVNQDGIKTESSAPTPLPLPTPLPPAGAGKKKMNAAHSPRSRQKPPLRGGKVKIAWDPETSWSGISDADGTAWAEAYPACDVGSLLCRMHEWLLSNPAKAHKKQWRRFITGWLSRQQERGGDRQGSSGDSGHGNERSNHRGRTGRGGERGVARGESSDFSDVPDIVPGDPR